ncbi:MAG: nitroreductase family deazaflavin-dependent oxidoreductase [Pseudonocardia sp.]
MKLTRPPRTRTHRAVARAPIWLYRLGLGGLLGHRFVLLTHTGRTTGRPRQVILEVVGREEESGGYLIASGYGTRSQWLRNILADPAVGFQVGRRRYTGRARPLPPAESGRRLAHYAKHHPRTAAALMRAIGQHVDGSAADYIRVGSDPAHGVPIVLLAPEVPTSRR